MGHSLGLVTEAAWNYQYQQERVQSCYDDTCKFSGSTDTDRNSEMQLWVAVQGL